MTDPDIEWTELLNAAEARLPGSTMVVNPNFIIAAMRHLSNIAVEECEQGHKFAKMPDHPRKDGLSRCPHCMAIGLDAAREELKAAMK